MGKVLITGATGSTGKNAIKKLLELKIPVRALVHKKDARSEQLSTQGVELVVGDLSDFDSVSAALKGISGAYFLYPIQVPGILEATAFFAQAARRGCRLHREHVPDFGQEGSQKPCRSRSLDRGTVV
jgi:NAD(P)H dehydrogenase (quinone)